MISDLFERIFNGISDIKFYETIGKVQTTRSFSGREESGANISKKPISFVLTIRVAFAR